MSGDLPSVAQRVQVSVELVVPPFHAYPVSTFQEPSHPSPVPVPLSSQSSPDPFFPSPQTTAQTGLAGFDAFIDSPATSHVTSVCIAEPASAGARNAEEGTTTDPNPVSQFKIALAVPVVSV